MGCVNSRANPNIFQVMNIDNEGNVTSPGRLEVTEGDIIFYQRDKQPITWPLRYLRQYGWDVEHHDVFSFEAGRRCFTGSGIYAFKCQRAEQLFNLVQSKIQVCNNGGDDTLSRDLPIPSHPAAQMEPNYLDPISSNIRSNDRTGSRFPHSQQNGRLSSVGSSSGPISPQETLGSPSPPSMLPPPPPISQPHPSSLYVNEKVLLSPPIEMERNNNKSLGRTVQRSPRNASTINNAKSIGRPVETELILIQGNAEITSDATSALPTTTAPYMNIEICSESNPISPTHGTFETNQLKEESNDIDGSEHAYVNIGPGQDPGHTENIAIGIRPPPLPVLRSDMEEGFRHCYANLEASEIESLRKRFSGTSVPEKSPLAPSTPTGFPIREEVNYAVLDLDKKDSPTGASNNTVNIAPSPPESPNKPQKGYATIDFNKTAALSHSVNPNLVNDNEGCRKTRHNSTISDLVAPCRHNSVSE
ncbi:uncharacterized protein LOC143894114 [Temnothorax americanus]|uniref:uncharacterized protein LOC143894114 n=1 Tax=Temnothorax americanus TaxID=1964332 RepID=UPI004067D30C